MPGPAPTQKIPCATAKHTQVCWKRKVSGVVLIVFAVLLGAALIPSPAAKPEKKPVEPDMAEEPFDIILSGTEQSEEPQDYAVVSEKSKKRARGFEVTIEGEKEIERADLDTEAKEHAEKAYEYMQKGDMTRALQFEARAVALAPNNMVYRLQLAIMNDRLSNADKALDLYRQVVEAYEENKRVLPPGTDIESIRNRMDFLAGP